MSPGATAAATPPPSPPPAEPAPDRAGGPESLSRSNRLLALALLATLLLWNVPYGWAALYPFKLFATWLHETSHAILMLATGAGRARMEIYPDTSGLAFPAFGVTRLAQAAISSVGYMGTAFFGAVFLAAGRTPRGARIVLAAIALAMLATLALFVRNPFGLAAIGTFAAVLLAAAAWLRETPAAFLVNFLAAQACINAVLDIRVLFGATMYVNGVPHGQSDASTVARMLGGPSWLWAFLWLVWSFALFYGALRWLRRHPEAGGTDTLAELHHVADPAADRAA